MISEENKLCLFISGKKPAAKPAPAAGAAPSGKKNVQKRWLYVAGGFVGLVVLANVLTTSKDDSKAAAPVPKNTSQPTINTTPPNADKDAFTSKFGQDLAAITQKVDKLEQENAEKDKKIAELKDTKAAPTPSDLPASVVPPPVKGGSNSGGLGAVGGATPPAPPVLPVRGAAAGSTAGVPPISMGAGATAGAELPPAIGYQSAEPLVFDAPQSSAKAADTASNASTQGVEARTKYTKNASAGMLPAGAFASVALLNGVDAGTGSSTQSNPMPVLLRVTDHATLPGAARYKLKSCFVLASAYGDMSSERVYARLTKLSCVD